MRRESEKRMSVCVWITDSLCCTPETNTTLCIHHTPIKSKLKKKKRGLVMTYVQIPFLGTLSDAVGPLASPSLAVLSGWPTAVCSVLELASVFN